MATIKDVAQHAGVSIATVSRVLNGAAGVEPRRAERVRAAIAALQYQPSRAARNLRVNRSQIIGLLISDIQNPFFTALVRGVEDVAQVNGYSVILCNSDEDTRKERQYADVLCAEGVAGVIVAPTRARHRSLQIFHDRGIPVVAIDRRVDDRRVDLVVVDNVRGACEAVAHLIANGHRRIGAIVGPATLSTATERLAGYREALRGAGLPHDPVLERSGSFKEESGLMLAEQLLDLVPPIDALFTANNLTTLGALAALQRRGLRVPEDIGLVAFDAMPWAMLAGISLTTVDQPVYELGSTAASRLLDRVRAGKAVARQEIMLATTLHVRRSSAPIAARRSVPASAPSRDMP